MPSVITFGEALIDFISLETGVSVAASSGFKKAAGGAPANVAVGLSRLGVKSAFVGKVGEDPFGKYLYRTLAAAGVDTTQLLFSREARTGLAFVSLTEDGEREFSFYRHPSADMLYHPDEINPRILDRAQIFHFGSLSLIQEPSRSAALSWITHARRRGLLISYDPNLRVNLWPDPASARRGIRSVWDQAQLIKLSAEEFSFLVEKQVNFQDLDQVWTAAQQLQHKQLKLLVITRGKDGCLVLTPGGIDHYPGYQVNAVDTTGAGDGFMAGLLAGLIFQGAETDPLQHLDEIIPLANAAGALTTLKKGAISALPTLPEVRELTSR
ncbi:MAG: PfkB family carbohydrate kinase [Anaerolineales bacterium]|nr:PfkB family carbohydrate kinase [Anaerolineales bacterium]